MKRLRARSRYFALAPLIMALMVLVFVGGQVREQASSLTSGRIEPVVMMAADMLPVCFHLWALLALWATFRDIGRGATFEPTIARGLRQLGWALLGSGIASAFLIPLIKIPIIRRSVAAGIMEPGKQVVSIDAAYLMLVLVGVAILLVARLFAMAASIRDRNQALETELGEFLQVPIKVTLDAILTRRGFTAREVAARVGISETQLSLFRSGKVRGIRFATLARMCAVLRCHPGDLLDYSPDAADLDPPERAEQESLSEA